MILYSNNCPRCKILKQKLKEHDMSFEESQNFETLISKGISSLPALELNDGQLLNFEEAMRRIEE